MNSVDGGWAYEQSNELLAYSPRIGMCGSHPTVTASDFIKREVEHYATCIRARGLHRKIVGGSG